MSSELPSDRVSSTRVERALAPQEADRGTQEFEAIAERLFESDAIKVAEALKSLTDRFRAFDYELGSKAIERVVLLSRSEDTEVSSLALDLVRTMIGRDTPMTGLFIESGIIKISLSRLPSRTAIEILTNISLSSPENLSLLLEKNILSEIESMLYPSFPSFSSLLSLIDAIVFARFPNSNFEAEAIRIFLSLHSIFKSEECIYHSQICVAFSHFIQSSPSFLSTFCDQRLISPFLEHRDSSDAYINSVLCLLTSLFAQSETEDVEAPLLWMIEWFPIFDGEILRESALLLCQMVQVDSKILETILGRAYHTSFVEAFYSEYPFRTRIEIARLFTVLLISSDGDSLEKLISGGCFKVVYSFAEQLAQDDDGDIVLQALGQIIGSENTESREEVLDEMGRTEDFIEWLQGMEVRGGREQMSLARLLLEVIYYRNCKM